MEELTYTDRNGNEFMVNIANNKVEGIYTYADTAYGDSVVSVDKWTSKSNGVFIHCPTTSVNIIYRHLKSKAFCNKKTI